MRFQNKVLFATGGASGIGAEVARRFTAEGGRVAIVDLDEVRAKTTASEIEGAVALGCDVSDEDSVERAVRSAAEQLGGLDCVLNAGGHAEFGPLEEWSLARWNKMLGVHVGGTFLVSKFALPHLRARGSGAIVNVASVAAFVAQRGNAPYGTAKAAIAGFTRQLALEVGPEIRVNCVAPGRTQTGMTEPIMAARGGGDVAKGAEVFGQGNIQKRVASAGELAAAVCFLLSDDASFVTGSTMVVDGGETVI